MGTSIVLAKVLGPYCLIVAAGVLLNLKAYQKVFEDFLKNSAVVYLSGVLALSFGLVLVLFHNIWVLDWPVLITVMGWLGVVKGVWLIVFPSTLPKAVEPYIRNRMLLVMRLMVVLAAGLVLTGAGYLIH
ncbi:MAG: hypothetical protein Q8Q08_01165 [Candidatus Omnitrophota bacterium]|nr:hypothetical protein [Candidatus Omnitrophota bacterium]MDZ4241284.1 hypothetical protein [Candidatus Omnitrophota bacterium]